MSKSLLKSIRFNMDDEKDKELYEFLSRLPRGEFSAETKEHWLTEMNKAKVRKFRNEMEREGR